MIMKKKSVNFLMKSVETPQQFSLLSSFIFIVLTKLYIFSRALIFLLIFKHNDLLQYEQQNGSYSISQLVNVRFDRLFHPLKWFISMNHAERFWISLYIYSDINLPLLVVNGCNFLCWHIIVLLSIRYIMFSDTLFIICMFLPYDS